jgi:hypothetical protein
MNRLTLLAERHIKLKGNPGLRDGGILPDKPYRTSRKVIQSMLANQTTVKYDFRIMTFKYKHVGVGVYEFIFDYS